ncbi:MAG: NAD(P)/FAD-dependent oxidoreductase [Prochloraceae cyanobacterium]|nr:NAD(P)/FAD-dependent oxidoreductase [Prochloraceae cyanobacterium]
MLKSNNSTNGQQLEKRQRVAIVGAGFGGMQAAQSLARSGVEVMLIDRNNYQTFVPLLYQVATAQIEPEKIAYPIRTIVRSSPNIRFLMAEVEHIDFANKVIKTDNTSITYDYLVLATGSQTQFLGIPGASEYAFSMRNLGEAIALRERIFSCFEKAAQHSDPISREHLLTFAIVGGGGTGVEVAGALSESLKVLAKDYPTLDLRQGRIILLQSSDRLLPDLPQKLGNYTYKRLLQMGVKVHLNAKVSRVIRGGVYLHDGESIPAATVVWTAGMEAVYPTISEKLFITAKSKLIVNPTLQLPGRSNVYAIGDLAYVEQRGKPLTGVAPEALQQGVAVAKNIKRHLQGKKPQRFKYFNKGRLAIIGSYSGVGKIGPFEFGGFLGWFMWLGVHLVYLPGYRSRLLVLLSWLHTYLVGDRTARSIVFSKTTLQKTPERLYR